MGPLALARKQLIVASAAFAALVVLPGAAHAASLDARLLAKTARSRSR